MRIRDLTGRHDFAELPTMPDGQIVIRKSLILLSLRSLKRKARGDFPNSGAASSIQSSFVTPARECRAGLVRSLLATLADVQAGVRR
jgi:hypothetical protein